MSLVVSGRSLGAELQKEGLLPRGCAALDVLVTPTGAVTITYTVNVVREDMAKFARAMLRAAGAPADEEPPA